MSLALFYDTETTGLPDWKSPSESHDQPHIVQLAAELVDTETREVICSMDVIVKPDGWTIPDDIAEIHGITTERATEVGIPERDAIAMLLELKAKANLRVAHNRMFDDRIIRIGLKRFFDKKDSEEADTQPSDYWKEGEAYCTAQGSRKMCSLPKNKIPTLGEAHQILVGTELEKAHNAMSDTRGCKAVYFAIVAKEAA